ncbi:hypothetical protein ACVWW6_005548 [Bradyrhizobium sp. USDA 3311]
MGFYRKKPVVVEAFEYRDVSNTDPSVPGWFVDAVLAGKVIASPNSIAITTSNGMRRAYDGDWIVRGEDGELYPYKPMVFAEAFEPADNATSIARNQISVTPPPLKREDSVLETFAGAGDMAENMGPPVVMAPYKPPKDKRVQGLLKDAAAARAAEAEAKPREIFRDPRLDPSYGKKKK